MKFHNALFAFALVASVALPATLAAQSSSPSSAPSGAAPVTTTASEALHPAVPAVSTVRVLRQEYIPQGTLIPAIKLPGPINIQPYGFFKGGPIYDSSNIAGYDFPLPLLSADTGPNADPQFRIKARDARLGASFEGVDLSKKNYVLGRIEMDFAGMFSTGSNGARNEVPRLRLGYVRYQHNFSESNSYVIMAGQAYTLFASSILPNTIESTSFMQGFGDPYDREPELKFEFLHTFQGPRKPGLEADIAIANPKYGILPNSPTNTAAQLTNELSTGEQQGPNSGRPEVHGRLVSSFQLDNAPNIQEAEVIISGFQGRRQSIITAANVPAAFQSAFSKGVITGNDRWGFTLETSLPTRFATVSLKYYNGSSLGSFNGAGQGFIFYSKTAGLTGTATALGTDNVSNVVFGFNSAGVATVAPQLAVRGVGGFAEIGLPLSRYFHPDPAGHLAGFDVNLHWGLDEAKARDVRQVGTTAAPTSASNSRDRSDGDFANIRYRYNRFLTYQFEQGYYQTRTLYNIGNANFALNPLFEGRHTHSGHDNRSEFQVMFTF